MKRKVIILASTVLLLSLCACQRNDTTKSANTANNSSAEAITEAVTEVVIPTAGADSTEEENTQEEIPGYEEAISELPDTVTIGEGKDMFGDPADKENFTPITSAYFVGCLDYTDEMNVDGVKNKENNKIYLLLSYDDEGGCVQRVKKYVFADESDAKAFRDYEFKDQGAVEEFTSENDSGASYSGDKVVQDKNVVYAITGPNYLKATSSLRNILVINQYFDNEKVAVTEACLKKSYEVQVKMNKGE